ncbi:MAG: HDOD domain-containing protein [Betaproteobacteria bacterium]|nr:HDOD domain-containing protein [Betaproteobacteria bacterium]
MPIDHPEDKLEPTTFRELARKIACENLPAFGSTLQEVLNATRDDVVAGQPLAEIILRDPALTSHVLRAANAAYLGHSGSTKVVTVSRAVVVLGINTIRSLCISAMAMESMATVVAFRHRVQAALGRALHAAVQARDMGLLSGSRREDAEQLFVEALLSSIGEMAFWCYGAAYAERLDRALKSGIAPARAEKEVLGTSLQQFNHMLLQAWNLGSVMRASREVALAERLSTATQQGWSNTEAHRATQAIGIFLRRPDVENVRRLQQNATQASTLATGLGANEAAQWIPVVDPAAADNAGHQAPAGGKAGSCVS